VHWRIRARPVTDDTHSGFAAQALTLRHPELVRRLVLVGTRPRGGNSEGADPHYPAVATRHEVPALEDFLFLFFEPSETSQAAGRAFWERRHQRTADVDREITQQAMKVRSAANAEWSQPRGEPFADLKRITQPTLVVQADTTSWCRRSTPICWPSISRPRS
jgi:pimeloyl-ACP methyl ester carboxylesterase